MALQQKAKAKVKQKENESDSNNKNNNKSSGFSEKNAPGRIGVNSKDSLIAVK